MRPLVAAVVAGAFAALAPAAGAMPMHGGGHGPMLSILGTAFTPDRTDVLAGDTVTWHNDSVLRHTVTAGDGSFTSLPLFGGEAYRHRFDTPGVVAYYCEVHPFMRGEVDVHRVLLDAPRDPGAPGAPYALSGRSALPAGTTVAIERDAGGGFVPAGSATVGDDGAFTAHVRSAATASYRAVAGGEASPAVRVVIVDRRVTAHVPHRGVVVARVAPASPGAIVVLQLRLREHFGWWPVARARVGRHSRARFVVDSPHHRVRARVVLTLSDGATQLARTKAFRVRPRG